MTQPPSPRSASRALAFLLLFAGLAACGSRSEQPESLRNDAQRQEALIANQALALAAEAENGTRVIEQALENETANVFENRDILLNEVASNVVVTTNAAR